jgi:molybdopterin/thiamine biosynthesis adenylyltransferase
MQRDAWHVVVAGAGVTGSHLAPHLARMPEIERVTLVDPEEYSTENRSQNIEYADVGKAKVDVQAERLRRIRPGLEVTPIKARIEDVPRGLVACGLFASCLDSKLSRLGLNSLAWAMGTSWFDCGVLGSQNLVRVSGYVPGEESACLECSWDPGPHGEYAVLEQEYLCGAGGGAFPSMATSALGALAASLLALEIAKLIRGEAAESIAGRQVILDAQHHRVQVTQERRNPWCRFNHRTWRVQPWRRGLDCTTVGAALRELGSLAVEGHLFVRDLVCPSCGREENATRLNRPLAHCAACGRRLASASFGSLERLHSAVGPEWTSLTLAQIGLRARDIVSAGTHHHYLLEDAG